MKAIENWNKLENKSISCLSGSPTYDPSVCMHTKSYCKVLHNLRRDKCLENNILELWGFDNDTLYESLTFESVLDKVNEPNPISVPFNWPLDLSQLLNVTRDASGKIIGASAASLWWTETVDLENMEDLVTSNSGFLASESSLKFEARLLETIESYQDQYIQLGDNNRIYANVAFSFDDIAMSAIFSNMGKLIVGFCLIYAYIFVSFGKFNCVEARVRWFESKIDIC